MNSQISTLCYDETFSLLGKSFKMGFFLIDTLILQPENAPKHENQDTLRKKRIIQCLSAKRKVFMLLMYKCLKSSLRTFQLILMNYSAAHYFLQKFLIRKYAQHIANESTTSTQFFKNCENTCNVCQLSAFFAVNVLRLFTLPLQH